MILSPIFWDWFNVWIIQFLKNFYNEIKMVALRRNNSSLNNLTHAYINHGNSQQQQNIVDGAQSLQTTWNMPQSALAQQIVQNHVHMQPLNVSLQFIQQQTNPNSLKRVQCASRYSNSNCVLPSHHYRLLAQGRAECYHTGASGAPYMANSSGVAQSSTQPGLRGQPTPQPSAPPAPPQDMPKNSMNYVSQNQTQQARPPYANFQFRATQHGSRPNTHPRQQQPFMPSGGATAAGPVMYPTLVFPPHMGMQTYQQQRSSASGYYPSYHYISYNSPPSHSSPCEYHYAIDDARSSATSFSSNCPSPVYYTPSNPQLPASNLPSSGAGGRNNPTTLVGPQGTPVTATTPTVSLPPQPPTHLHQTMSGIRSAAPKRVSHRLPIIDPVTRQDIFSDLYSSDSYLSGESSDRQTPQPDSSVAEQFNRMVNEVANQPADSSKFLNFTSKTVESSITSTPSTNLPIPNAISSINNNIVKSDSLSINENKNLGPDVAAETNETPIVSAISDSPVIVPKMPINVKQFQKNSDLNIISVALDSNKNVPSNKQHKQIIKFKPVVPQNDDVEKLPDSLTVASSNIPIETVTVTATLAPAPVSAPVLVSAPLPVSTPLVAPPQPQRIREPRERIKSQERDSIHPFKSNGPLPTVISSVDSIPEVINLPTSQNTQFPATEATKKLVQKPTSPLIEIEVPIVESKPEVKVESPITEPSHLSATELLSASIEKVAKELPTVLETQEENNTTKETSSAIEAQVKLTQSLSSVLRNIHPESKMKDINLNNKTTDPDTANGNSVEVINPESVHEELNKNENVVKNDKDSNKKSIKKMASNEENALDNDSYENGKDETDKVVNVEHEEPSSVQEATLKTADKPEAPKPAVFVPKYKYSEDQWSPLNKSGKKYYDIGLLKQIKDAPLSKNKPNAPLLEACNVIRTAPMMEPMAFSNIIRPVNDSIFPSFILPSKGSGMGSRNNTPREAKKDGRNMAQGGKGSAKLPSSGAGNNALKPVIHVSLSLREEVKLNEVDSAWKPTRFRKDNTDEEEFKTQELYKKFRGILNKLTPQKFDTLLDKVRHLDINNQKRLEGVIDLVFEKAIEEPNFSEAYAAMCNKLSMLKVPADNPSNPDQCVNFRALIITKCQNQFETDKVDQQILKLENEHAECQDPVKKKELFLTLQEETRKMRMRSVGNVRFIGELYKLKMLTSKIMDYCMKYLIDKLEEEKLECLCKLLTTIGGQFENESNTQLDSIFKRMQEIVDRRTNRISSRVRFMIQDVIELRKRKWVVKSVVDSQPKMMDQIQKEAEQQQRHIELMNANPGGGGFRRDEGSRGKRGDNRRQNNNSYMDTWKPARSNPLDTMRLKAVTQNSQKNLTNVKLAPHHSAWNQGSSTKTPAQASSNSIISLSKNMYSVLENIQTDPTSLRANRDMPPTYHSKGASIERSTFNSRGDFNSGSGGRSESVNVNVGRSNSTTRSPAPPLVVEPPAPTVVEAEPLTDAKKKSVKAAIDLCLINNNNNELVVDIKQLFPPQYHAAVITEIMNIVLEKSAKELALISKSVLHLVSTNTISSANFLAGMKEIFEFAADLYIDIPMLYEYFSQFIAPLIEKKHITFVQIFGICEPIISSHHGHLFLKVIIKDLIDSMGPTFVKSKWQESGLQLKDWMNEDQVQNWIKDNQFEFLEGDTKATQEIKNKLSPAETQSKLLQLMNSDETSECIKGWVQDKFDRSSNEDWFMRALIQAICEHALFGPDGRDIPHFSQDRMNKYAGLINEFGDSKELREASCLFGIQQLIHRLEHPQGLTLEIFQYLHEQYIISLDGFIAWEESDKEPEGKGVMMKALTSFFTNIKEADNEESGSED